MCLTCHGVNMPKANAPYNAKGSANGRKMKLSSDYLRGIGVGMVAAGISAIIIQGNAGHFAVIMGVCALMLGYTLWVRERNEQIVGKGW